MAAGSTVEFGGGTTAYPQASGEAPAHAGQAIHEQQHNSFALRNGMTSLLGDGTSGNWPASAHLRFPQSYPGSIPDLFSLKIRLSNWAAYGQDERRLGPAAR